MTVVDAGQGWLSDRVRLEKIASMHGCHAVPQRDGTTSDECRECVCRWPCLTYLWATGGVSGDGCGCGLSAGHGGPHLLTGRHLVDPDDAELADRFACQEETRRGAVVEVAEDL